jgi:hypothetical protein
VLLLHVDTPRVNVAPARPSGETWREHLAKTFGGNLGAIGYST